MAERVSVVETFNGSAWSTARDRMDRTGAKIMCVQELKCLGQEAVNEASQQALHAGWKPALGLALRTTEGYASAGTGVLVRSNIPVAGLIGVHGRKEGGFCIVDGRATGCRVWHVVPGCLIVVSIYLEDGVGLSDGNWQVLLRVGEVLAAHGLPFIVCGDFNLPAEALETSGWLRRVQAKTFVSKEGTCRSAGGKYSHIDYFVVSDGLAPSVTPAEVVTSEPAKPHRPVQLGLKGAPRAAMERHLTIPKRFPVKCPIGCAPPPPPWSLRAAGLDELKGQERLDAHYRFLVAGIEMELLDAFGIDDDDAAAYLGRADAPEEVWRCALPPATNGRPRSSAAGRRWRWLGQRCEAACRAMEVAAGGEPGGGILLTDSAGLAEQLRQIWNGASRTERDIGVSASWWREWLQPLFAGEACTSAHYIGLKLEAEQAFEAAGAEEKRFAEKRAGEFRAWAMNATKDGAREAHAFAKPPRAWAPTVVKDERGVERYDGQSFVDAQCREWIEVWDADAEALEEELEMPPGAVLTRLVPYLVEEARAGARTFKEYTGLGGDALRPRHAAHYSDGALGCLCHFWFQAEQLGFWATGMRLVLMHLLAKASAGWWVIGLMNSFYRIWARLRVEVSRAWFGKLDRSYLAFGEGKAADAAAFDVALWSEAIDDDEGGMQAITTLTDLEKGFEKVHHKVVMKAAVKHGYPLVLARFALNM